MEPIHKGIPWLKVKHAANHHNTSWTWCWNREELSYATFLQTLTSLMPDTASSSCLQWTHCRTELRQRWGLSLSERHFNEKRYIRKCKNYVWQCGLREKSTINSPVNTKVREGEGGCDPRLSTDSCQEWQLMEDPWQRRTWEGAMERNLKVMIVRPPGVLHHSEGTQCSRWSLLSGQGRSLEWRRGAKPGKEMGRRGTKMLSRHAQIFPSFCFPINTRICMFKW